MRTVHCVWRTTLTGLLCVSAFATASEAEKAKSKRAFQMLVEPAQLQQKLNEEGVRILDVRSSEDYNKGHIPGALRVDVGGWKALALTDGGLQDAKGWAAKLGALGINPNTQVVVYGGSISDAARIWWLLKYVGVEHASLLNGGWESWAKLTVAAETATPEPDETQFKPAFPSERIADIGSLKKSLKSDQLEIVDTRSDTEFAGGWSQWGKDTTAPVEK